MPDIDVRWIRDQMKSIREQQIERRNQEIKNAVETLKRQMHRRGPTQQQLEQYPAVQDAWERYLTIAALHGINDQ